MRGSLDDPPIVIRQDRLKLGLSLIFMILLETFISARMWTDPTLFHSLRGYVGIACMCVLIPIPIYFSWVLVRPGTLTISPRGVTVDVVFRRASYSWGDIKSFAAARMQFLGPRMVYLDFSDDYMRSGKTKNAWSTLGGFWELGPDEILSIISRAQQHWGMSK